MPHWSEKGKWKEIDPVSPETDPDLTETDPDLTQSDPDLIDADDYAAYDEDQAGPSFVFYCTECCDHLDGREGPLCINCELSEAHESRQRQIDGEPRLCCHCHRRQADQGFASCTPCRQQRNQSEARRVAERKKKKEKEKKRDGDKKK
ncbi:hypothetical protein CEP54_008115 [Fusarium duplospermum]|uniref:Uncharacterized protein n=1 Tax=Fusarium duplospermum TaxID=1325734 RepID=A0A428PXJ9_9HYPO|nr:hypothetical protein CEP54_008115 [Fusarium duplospermum]